MKQVKTLNADKLRNIIKECVKRTLNELDWKTYMDAANERFWRNYDAEYGDDNDELRQNYEKRGLSKDGKLTDKARQSERDLKTAAQDSFNRDFGKESTSDYTDDEGKKWKAKSKVGMVGLPDSRPSIESTLDLTDDNNYQSHTQSHYHHNGYRPDDFKSDTDTIRAQDGKYDLRYSEPEDHDFNVTVPKWKAGKHKGGALIAKSMRDMDDVMGSEKGKAEKEFSDFMGGIGGEHEKQRVQKRFPKKGKGKKK